MRRVTAFTLIELMIVVAIISLLAAIAIPNFLKFQCKTKQSEAKAGLGGLFTSEKAFLGEHNTYGTDLVNVNWQPEGSPRYLYGFNAVWPASASLQGITYDGNRNNTSRPDVACLEGDCSRPKYSTVNMRKLSGVALAPGDLPFTTCDGQEFLMGAVGDISPDLADTTDAWYIDHRRQMRSVQNDCAL